MLIYFYIVIKITELHASKAKHGEDFSYNTNTFNIFNFLMKHAFVEGENFLLKLVVISLMDVHREDKQPRPLGFPSSSSIEEK